jgi:hypothetical protein
MSESLMGRLFEEIKLGLFEEIKPRMQAAMESAFDEAWDAAMRRLQAAPAAGVVAPKPIQAPLVEKAVVSRPKPPGNVGNRAAWGAARKVILGAFDANKSGGMTPKTIADWGVGNGQKVAASSVRTMLQKMQKSGEVRRRKERYFPATIASTARSGEENPSPGPTAPEEARPGWAPNGSWPPAGSQASG